jgi:hypothetical protein
VSRRVRVPAADDLFRPTAVPDQPEHAVVELAEAKEAKEAKEIQGAQGDPKGAGTGAGAATGTAEPEVPETKPARRPSGRVRHDEKMTVYVTSEELLAIEHARLTLRGEHGLAVDRGRLVRAAVALALADLDAHGRGSALVERLGEE